MSNEMEAQKQAETKAQDHCKAIYPAVLADTIAELKGLIDDSFVSCTVWRDDGCEYDCSGELVEIFDDELILAEFDNLGDMLEKTYTGETLATYTSGMGLQYVSVAETLYSEVKDRYLEACELDEAEHDNVDCEEVAYETSFSMAEDTVTAAIKECEPYFAEKYAALEKVVGV